MYQLILAGVSLGAKILTVNVNSAKKFGRVAAKRPNEVLNEEEIAAIHLYTQETPVLPIYLVTVEVLTTEILDYIITLLMERHMMLLCSAAHIVATVCSGTHCCYCVQRHSISLWSTPHFFPVHQVYALLNACLRDKDRKKIKPWLPYVKLLLVAIYKLPLKTVSGCLTCY